LLSLGLSKSGQVSSTVTPGQALNDTVFVYEVCFCYEVTCFNDSEFAWLKKLLNSIFNDLRRNFNASKALNGRGPFFF